MPCLLLSLSSLPPAHSYVQLKLLPMVVTDLSHANLLALHTRFKKDILDSIAANFGPSQPTKFTDIVLNEDTLPDFGAMVAKRQLTFTTTPCDWALRGYSHVYVKKASGLTQSGCMQDAGTCRIKFIVHAWASCVQGVQAKWAQWYEG